MHADWIELLKLFEKGGVRSLIIGGMAVAFHGHERFTKDIDVWVSPEPQNARKVLAALTEFGAPVARLKASDFEDKDSFVVIGAEPFRIDLIMGPPGVSFNSAWKSRVPFIIDGVTVNYVSIGHLIALKKAAGRAVDKRDIKALTKSAAPTKPKKR